MTSPVSTLRNYVELSRLSNLPTVISNVLVGVGFASTIHAVEIIDAVAVAVGVSLLYVGGMALNDAVDARVDALERSTRPIPSGRIGRTSAYAYACIMLTLGAAAILILSPHAFAYAAALVAAIVLYDLFHKRWAASAVLMGLARGLVYFVAFIKVVPDADDSLVWMEHPFIAGVAAATMIYTICLTIVARAEARPRLDVRRLLAFVIPLFAVGVLFAVQPTNWPWVLSALSLHLVWQVIAIRHVFADPPSTKKAVLTWLAGFCLMDMFFLATLNLPMFALGALICFAVTVIGHRRIAGT